jgi:hypothetical protein
MSNKTGDPIQESSAGIFQDFSMCRIRSEGQDGAHAGFLRLNDAYDRAMAAFRHAAA